MINREKIIPTQFYIFNGMGKHKIFPYYKRGSLREAQSPLLNDKKILKIDVISSVGEEFSCLQRSAWQRIFFFSLFIILLMSNSIYPQDVERATRETDRLGKEKIEEKLRMPPPKPPGIIPKEGAPSKEEEEERFFIKKINLVGCESVSAELFSHIIARFENKENTLTDLKNLADQIAREYLRQGIIAAVFVPPQEVKEQSVILQVVEARMGELNIKEHRYFNKNRLRYYWKVYSGQILHYDKISKSLQMMNKNPDRQVKAALQAGKAPGTTDIVLTAETRFPLHFTSSFDNEGSLSTGTSRMGFELRHNNFLGLDDTFLIGHTYGHAFGGSYLYHTLPISSESTSLVYGCNRSRSTPKKEFIEYEIISRAENFNLSLHQDLFKKDEYKGKISIGFDAKDKTTAMNTGVVNRDRLRIISLGFSSLQRGFASTTSSSLNFSQGLKAFGASKSNNPLASRKAKPAFSKFNLGLEHKRPLPFNLATKLKFNTQLAPKRLTPQEQFSLGGIGSVRGYPSGDYSADNAFFSSTELLIPAFFIPDNLKIPYEEKFLKEQITSLVFLDYGWGMKRQALQTEKRSVNQLSIGTGLRITFLNQGLLRLEWGFPLGANRSVTEPGHSHFHFSVDFQDKLPEEIERIRKIEEERNIRELARHLVNAEFICPDSGLQKKIFHYLYLAEHCYRQARLKEAKGFYEKIKQIAESLYKQAEAYVRSCIKQQKELHQKRKMALVTYKDGNLSQVKQLWQGIVDEAKPKQLIFEF